MYVVVAYDIKSDKSRNFFAKEMLKFGIRTQKSFFECEVSEGELKLIKKLAKKVCDKEDFVTIYLTEKRRFKRIGDVEYLEIDDLVF